MKKAPKNTLTEELLDQLLSECGNPSELLDGPFMQELKRKLVNRALQAEMNHHLGYKKYEVEGHHSGNSRNGSSKKSLKCGEAELKIEVPRDRKGDFEPQIVGKYQRRINGFDEKILSMYSRGMSTREIQGYMEEIYGMEISPSLISEVTDEVLDEVKQWQSRPLDPSYPIVYLDALVVKIRNEHEVKNQAIYLALGVNTEGQKEVLGLWASENEGAKFWLQVLTELKNRGLKDILIACIDGLKGF